MAKSNGNVLFSTEIGYLQIFVTGVEEVATPSKVDFADEIGRAKFRKAKKNTCLIFSGFLLHEMFVRAPLVVQNFRPLTGIELTYAFRSRPFLKILKTFWSARTLDEIILSESKSG